MIYLLLTPILLVATPNVEAASIKENWYLYRARDNIKIQNYKAAIEAYENVLLINPTNDEASRNLGLAYEKQGMADKAVNQYDRYLESHPGDGDIALRQARLLKWERYSYRQNDAIKYYRVALNKEPSPAVRLEYGELLAANKETVDESVVQFEAVLRQQPRNAKAHRGLAKAYAWLGDEDKALYHTQKARSLGDKNSDVRSLQTRIMKDRQPEVGGETNALQHVTHQQYQLSAVQIGAFGNFDPTAFSSLGLQLANESYWSGNDFASGASLGLTGEYRPQMGTAWNTMFKHHTAFTNGNEVEIRYSESNTASQWASGLRHEIVNDSYLAIVGRRLPNRTTVGQARRSSIFYNKRGQIGDYQWYLAPKAGLVSAQSIAPNLYATTNAQIEKIFWRLDGLDIGIRNDFTISHYQTDRSSTTVVANQALPGGYFSPQLFLQDAILIRLSSPESQSARNAIWFFDIGPNAQFTQMSSQSSKNIGIQLSGQYLQEVRKSVYLKAELSYLNLEAAYDEVRAQASVIYQISTR